MKKLLLPLLLLAVLVGCKKEEPKEEIVLKDDYVFPPIYTTATQITLAEKPDIRRVLLIGDKALNTTNLFTNAGVKPETSIQGKYDAVFVACEGMSKESSARMLSLLTENGIAVWMMDTQNLKMGEFKEMLSAFDSAEAHLWMPGETTWLLVGRKGEKQIKLSAMMESFAREEAYEDLAKASLHTLPELFASYVGRRDEIVGAFEDADMKALVKPEYFLPREIGKIGWISGDVDEDILKLTLDEMRSMQVIRRLIVEGSISAQNDQEEEAIDKFARAALRNPNDPMLLERIDRLNRNAEGFIKVGRVLQAMKCYENILGITPKDVKALTNIGMCFKTIGKLDLAEKAFERAQELSAQ